MKVVIRALGIVMLTLAAGRCGTAEEPKIRRFDVVPVDDKAILVDTATGATWILEKSPTADNKSGHIWQKIPSPWDALSPIEMPAGPSVPVDSVEGQALVPLAPPSFSPPPALEALPDESVTLEIKSPSKMPIGESAMFALHVAGDEAFSISEVRIQLPASFAPRQASQNYERDGEAIVWRDVEVPSGTVVALAVKAEATQLDKKAAVCCTAKVDGRMYQVEKKVVVHGGAGSEPPLWQPVERSDENTEE